jgi:hypothetical protein
MIKNKWLFSRSGREFIDPFSDTKPMNEKEESNQLSYEFYQYSPTRDRKLNPTEQHHQCVLAGTYPVTESPGIKSSAALGTFPGAASSTYAAVPDLIKPPATLKLNPFADSTTLSTPKSNHSGYIANARQSRGHPPPRQPSTIRTTNYQDTVFSALTESERGSRGRSDPFDLERIQLFHPAPNPLNISPVRHASQNKMQPRIESVQLIPSRVASEAPTYSSSKYSSGISTLLNHFDLDPSFWGGALPGIGDGLVNENRDKTNNGNHGGHVGIAMWRGMGNDVWFKKGRRQGRLLAKGVVGLVWNTINIKL